MPSSEPLRYVVLHHTGIDNPHFDLMVETVPGGALATWRCQHWPPVAEETFAPIGDHRRTYLDYEGPVSGGRGRVVRVAAGECRLISQAGRRHLRLEDGSEYPLTPSPGA